MQETETGQFSAKGEFGHFLGNQLTCLMTMEMLEEGMTPEDEQYFSQMILENMNQVIMYVEQLEASKPDFLRTHEAVLGEFKEKARALRDNIQSRVYKKEESYALTDAYNTLVKEMGLHRKV
jgi:hypothetical protein